MNKRIIIALFLIVGIGSPAVYLYTQLPKYSNAIVLGHLVNFYQGSDIRPGFNGPDAWYLNISLAKGTHGNLSVIPDEPCQGQCYPFKSDGLWYYLIIVNCNIYKAGDEIDLRVPIYAGGNIWYQPEAVQGYNYLDVAPHYDFPALYRPQGIGFEQIQGC